MEFRPVLLAAVILSMHVTTATANDEAAVRQVADAYAVHWNQHDARAMADLFTSDASWVDVHAGYFRGRDEIYRLHEGIHTRWQKNSRTKHNDTHIRLVQPDIAVAVIRWELHGDARGPDVRHGVMTFVITRQIHGWRIAAAQNTEMNQPVWAKKGIEVLGTKPKTPKE